MAMRSPKKRWRCDPVNFDVITCTLPTRVQTIQPLLTVTADLVTPRPGTKGYAQFEADRFGLEWFLVIVSELRKHDVRVFAPASHESSIVKLSELHLIIAGG